MASRNGTGGAQRRSSFTPSAYAEHRDHILAILARRCGWLDYSDREALFHDACLVLLEKERSGHLDVSAMRPLQVRAYLAQTSLNKAMDEGKRAGRRRTVSLDDEMLGLDPVDPGRGLDDRLGAHFDSARVREIVAELPGRQQAIIELRFFLGLTPDAVQRRLAITGRVYRREFERATRHIVTQFDLVRRGTFCDSRRSLIIAYVSGIAGPHRAADARRHLANCPSCAGLARELRARRADIAA
jgi:DNA-directed RNA polymerase specialized sigma24 family protein